MYNQRYHQVCGGEKMKCKLTLQEKLRDLRDERKLVLAGCRQYVYSRCAGIDILADVEKATGIPISTLQRMESDEDIRVGYQDVMTLAKFYEVSADFLFGLTENRIYRNVAIDELGLTDSAVKRSRNIS
jgi:transcriptional regulator with XRE-family HTH domain